MSFADIQAWILISRIPASLEEDESGWKHDCRSDYHTTADQFWDERPEPTQFEWDKI